MPLFRKLIKKTPQEINLKNCVFSKPVYKEQISCPNKRLSCVLGSEEFFILKENWDELMLWKLGYWGPDLLFNFLKKAKYTKCFLKKLDLRQPNTLTIERQEINEVNFMIAPIYCLEREFRLWDGGDQVEASQLSKLGNQGS